MILIGDVRDVLPTLDGESVQMCLTSPPYWGLRDYGVDGQLGLEPTLEEYVANMVGVFREVRRVLKDDGTLWLNLGDSYSSGGRGAHDAAADNLGQQGIQAGKQRPDMPAGLKAKDLIGIPWRVAFALQADGWYLRQDIIWHKSNPMPESVKDRCTKAHEYLFLLSKSARYYFDAEAIKEDAVQDERRSIFRGGAYVKGSTFDNSQGGRASVVGNVRMQPEKRNRRSVWTIAAKPCKEAHFATFPPKLIEPCILSGSRPGDVVLDPFLGSGTTGEVCERLSRRWVGVDLNAEYGDMAKRRTAQMGLGL